MKNISILKRSFAHHELERMDKRIIKAIEGWEVVAVHKGKDVIIPGTWDAVIYPYKYFEIYKSDTDVNPGEDENEIQCYLSCGWRGTDDEAVIVLTILGYDVLSGVDKVGAEIYRFGGDAMKVYKDNKLITDFTQPRWWNKLFGKPRRLEKFIVENVLR